MTRWASHRHLFLCLLGVGLITSSQFASSTFALPVSADGKDTLTTLSQSVDSQPVVSDALLSSTQLGQWLQRFRPPQDGQPRSTSNGSSRDQRSCNAAEPAMQAQLSQDRYGLTLEERPEIFVDTTGTSARQALLIMRSEDSASPTYYLQSLLPVSNTEGLSSFQLPQESPPLATGQTYSWSLSFLCGEFSTPSDPTFTGWVRRVPRSSETEQVLNSASVQQQAHWLSENGYWYDLIAKAVETLE